jgi:hypothetical protein
MIRAAWRIASVVVLASAVATALLVVAPFAQGRSAANPTLDLNFFANGTITLTLPDGSPVGTASGAPTVIPAGYYAVVVIGPGGCTQLPLFDLKGPGENIVDDMSGGEVTSETYQAYFAPNSTYTWRTDNVNPSTVYTFTTNSTVLGAPVHGIGPPSGTTSTKLTSGNIVGSAVVPLRGKLAAAVASNGKVTLRNGKGKAISTLVAGRYTIAVSDSSRKAGFLVQRLQKPQKNPRALTGIVFVGRHSVTVNLTAGKWCFRPSFAGAKTVFLVDS